MGSFRESFRGRLVSTKYYMLMKFGYLEPCCLGTWSTWTFTCRFFLVGLGSRISAFRVKGSRGPVIRQGTVTKDQIRIANKHA